MALKDIDMSAVWEQVNAAAEALVDSGRAASVSELYDPRTDAVAGFALRGENAQAQSLADSIAKDNPAGSAIASEVIKAINLATGNTWAAGMASRRAALALRQLPDRHS